MNRKQKEESIQLEAMSLGIDESTRTIECPYCAARGDAVAGSFIVTRISEGVWYKCFRASCNKRGFISGVGSDLYIGEKKKKPKIKYFDRPLTHLPAPIRRWLRDSYNITEDDIVRNHLRYDFTVNYIHMPVYNKLGYEIGGCIKRLPQEFLHDNVDREYYDTQHKSVLYLEKPQAVFIHWPVYNSTYTKIVIVEDILSAIRVQQFPNVRAVALLGTTLSEDKVGEIHSVGTNVILALDPDTWYNQSKFGDILPMMYKAKYSLFFNSFKVAKLTKDPKDLNDSEIQQQIIGV